MKDNQVVESASPEEPHDHAPDPSPEVAHHAAEVNGTRLHYVTAGDRGAPILLVHGFPETWWAFHRVIPRLGAAHRGGAGDLRGFGDSGHGPGGDGRPA